MSLIAGWRLRSVQKRIRLTRAARLLSVTAAALEGTSLALNLASGAHALALLITVPVVLFTANAVLQTVLIRQLRREEATLRHQARPRVDWAAVAAMETEIWGHAFKHAGAPDEHGDGA